MNIGLLVVRIIVGLYFVGHGAQKLFGVAGGYGLNGTGQFFESMGLRPGRLNAFVAGAAELSAGVLLALGLLTPLAAALVIGVMIVAIATVHLSKGVWTANGGYELNLVYIAAVFALAGVGAGEWRGGAAVAPRGGGHWRRWSGAGRSARAAAASGPP